DRDAGIIYRVAEHAAGEGGLSFAEPALAADGAGERRCRQRSSPAARTSAGKLTLSPPTKVTVTSVWLPATTVSARSFAIACSPLGSNLSVSPAGSAIWNISSIDGWLFQVPIWCSTALPAPCTDTARIIRSRSAVLAMSK